MVINVGINGFGRIGRVIFRTCCQHPDLEIAAINDPAIELSYICYLIKFDSTHGKYNGNISYDGNEIKIDGHSIKVFHQKAPSDIPWEKAGVQYVIEASGMFTNMEKASGHLMSEGVRRVLVTAPSSDVPMLILGVNQDRISADVKVLSCTSSTLYCLAPIIKLLQDEFGVGEGFITSIHAMTPSLKPLDGLCIRGKHWRDHRSIHQNIIPAATGACKALGRIIPAVRDKLAGLAFRVPIVNVSVLDLCIRLNKNTTMKEITECIEKIKDPTLQSIIQVSKEQAVSSDFIGDSHSCTMDVDSSIQLRPNFFKLICWYENEFSYACRVVDTILYSERQYSLVFTPLSKMTYVRPIFWKTTSEQTDSKKYPSADCVSNSKFPLSICDSCECRLSPRSIQRPLSPYVSEASKLSKRSVSLEDTKMIKALIDKYAKSGAVKDKINLPQSNAMIKQIFHERVKAQERLDLVKQEFSKMVNITEDLLKKPSAKHFESVLVSRVPSQDLDESEESNEDPSVLKIKSSTQGINVNDNLNTLSNEMAISPPEEVRDNETVNTNFAIALSSPLKETTRKEHWDTCQSGSVIKSAVRVSNEEENSKARAHLPTITNLRKGTTENKNSNYGLLKSTAGKKSKVVTEAEHLNNCSSKEMADKEILKPHSSGLKMKSPTKGFTGKDNYCVNSSRTRVTSPSRAICEKGYSSTHLVTKSPSKGTSDRGYSNVHICSFPVRRPFKEVEKPVNSLCSANVTMKKSPRDITENVCLHKLLTTNESKSLSKATELEEHMKDDIIKMVTDSIENNNEIHNLNLTENSVICKESKSPNNLFLSDAPNCKGDIDSLNKLVNKSCNEELPILNSSINTNTNKTANLVGLNVLRKIYQTCDKNVSLKSKTTIKNNSILWDNIQKPKHQEYAGDSNTGNKLEGNRSSSSNVDSSIFDDNDAIDEKYNTEEVIQIVSENPEHTITSSNVNTEINLNVSKSQELLEKYSSEAIEAIDLENVRALTAELLSRRISKIEIVDEKLKQRNIVLVDHGKVNSKIETDTNQKNNTVPSNAGDCCQDVSKNTSRDRENGSSSSGSIKLISEMTSLCVSPVNTVTTISNNETYRSKQDIYDKLDSASVSGSENSFQMLEKKSQIINITDLTYSLDDLARLDKICRIIEISDELSDKLFSPLDDSSEGGSSKQKWSFKDLCKRIKLDEFCNNVFGKTSM